MQIKEVMLFAYDFPHKKTQDFLLQLLSQGYKVKYVIAAPWEKLNIPASSIHTSCSHSNLIHRKKLCALHGIKYITSKHNSQKTIQYLKDNPVQLYIISGARILKANVITACHDKVLNIHPGLLPECRGLDTLLWSIYKDIPIGMCAHFISKKIDCGNFIHQKLLILKEDDTIFDVSLRLLEEQSNFLIEAIKILKSDFQTKNLDTLKVKYHSKMPPELEVETLKKLPKWLKKHSKQQ
ncbi:hypothetical protein JKY72_00195 [Candidatus Gracilibacteria bacterium]|nr:hypothetical protein [Candidatus Gracilibacteria bacterium]